MARPTLELKFSCQKKTWQATFVQLKQLFFKTTKFQNSNSSELEGSALMIWKHIFSEFRRFRRLPDKNVPAVFYWKQLKYGKLKLLFSVIEYYIHTYMMFYMSVPPPFCFCSPKGTIMKIRSILTCIMLSLPLYLNCKTFRCVYCFL